MAENLLDDGSFDFALGQDAYHAPDRIQENQYAKGVNVTVRGGRPGTANKLEPRPGWHERDITFDAGFLTTSYRYQRTHSSIWKLGKFQAAIPFTSGNDIYVITVVCGLIFRTNLNTYQTALLSDEIRVNQFASRINWSYADDKIVLFDFPANFVVIDGTDVSRSEDLTATLGCYNGGRLFVADSLTGFTASDQVGNKATPDAPLSFLEIFTPSGDFFQQSFNLPTDDAIYPITAMGFIQELDTSTGIGSMYVASEKKIYFYRTNQPRINWGPNFGGVLLNNVGMNSPRSVINVNSDVVFTSHSDVYAFSTSRNDFKKWGNTPLSREVSNYLKLNDPALSRFSVLGYFDNRIFISANPYRVQALTRDQRPVTDYAHGGFVVLELGNGASLLQEGNPIWAGLWTGINPMEIFNIGSRCFVISKDGDELVGGANALYELTDTTYDVIHGNKRIIRSIIYSRKYDFKSPTELKRENSLTVDLKDLEGDIALKIERRVDHGSRFVTYAKWKYKATSFLETIADSKFINGKAPCQLPNLIFGDATLAEFNPVTNEPYTVFRTSELRLTIEGGYWTLQGCKLRAVRVPAEERQDVNLNNMAEEIDTPAEQDPDWQVPEVVICHRP